MIYLIDKNTYREIIDFFYHSPIESGGIIGKRKNVILAFYPDTECKRSIEQYTPNINELNSVIEQWSNKGIEFIGIIHSHPNGNKLPSILDEKYVSELLMHNTHLKCILFPIVTLTNNKVEIHFYKFKSKFKKIRVLIKK